MEGRAIESVAGGFGIHRGGASIEMRRETLEALLLSCNAELLLLHYNTQRNRRELLISLRRLWKLDAGRRADSNTRR